MKVSNWAVVVIMLAILIGCAGGGTSTFVERPGGIQPISGNPEGGQDAYPGDNNLQVGVEPIVDKGSEGHAGLPAFPGSGGDAFSPVHKVSEAEYQTSGDGYVAQFGANNRDGETAGEYVLIPEEGDIAWAMYSIPDFTGDRPVRIELAVTPAELETGSGDDLLLSYWIGVADYTLFHWDWFGPYTGVQDVEINSEELRDRYVSKDGTLHWVAVLYGDEEGGLPGVTLQSGTVVTDPGYFANKPHYTPIDSIEVGSGAGGGGGKGPSGRTPVPGDESCKSTFAEAGATKATSGLKPSQFITIDWSHVPPFTVEDEKNQAFQYWVFRRGPTDLVPQLVDIEQPTQTNYTDPTDNGEDVDPPIPGAAYKYYVRAYNLIGLTPFSYYREASVPFLAPTDLLATGDNSSIVGLTWQAAEAATSYEVFRDSQDTPIATISDIDATPASPAGPGDREWDDVDVSDYFVHTYWLKSVNQYATSGFSEPDAGNLADAPSASLTILPGQESGTAPHTVDFDASASYDPDGGGIDTYDWDWDGDGTFDVFGGAAIVSHIYQQGNPQGGPFIATVKVTDDEGTSDTASIEISVDSRGDWWMFGRVAAHNRSSPFNGPTTNALDWSYAAGGNVFSSPATGSDGTVYFGCLDTKLYAVNPNGSHKWSYALGNFVYSSPAVGVDGTVYIGSYDNQLYAINADGSLKWSFPTGDDVNSSPAIGPDGTVYVGSDDSKLYAINPDGSGKWSYTTGGPVKSSPAIGAGGSIFFGSYDYKLYAIYPDGSIRWTYLTGGEVHSSPAIAADGTVYVGSLDNNLFAINPDGSFKWLYLTGGEIRSSPAIGADGTVYVGSGDSKLYAINPGGTEKWAYTTGSPVISSPAIGMDGTVYVGSQDFNFYAIKPDGSLIWSYTAGNSLDSSPAIGDNGTVYVGGIDNYLYAFGPGNEPIAVLDADPVDGTFPLTVNFDASASFDVDGTIVQYDWDWENDGVWDSIDGGATPSHTYTTWGVYRAVVRVTDNDAKTDTASIDINANFTWQTHTVDSTGIVGNGTSIANLNGVPAIAYRDATNGSLKYAQASSPLPTSAGDWNSYAVVTGNDGRHPSIKVLAGKPIISDTSYDDNNGNLRYALAAVNSPTGPGDWSRHLVDDDGTFDNGYFSSLIIIGGKPAIASYSYGLDNDGNLRYARSIIPEPTGTSDWVRMDAATTGKVGYSPSLVLLGLVPAIAYFDNGNKDLGFAIANSATPSNPGNWATHSIETVGSIGNNPSCIVLNGKPAVAYRDATNSGLKYAYSIETSPGSAADWVVHTVYKTGIPGASISCIVLNGRPVIAHYNSDSGDLQIEFAVVAEPGSSADWVHMEVDTTDNVGDSCGIAIIDNRPAISYQDLTNEDLKFARPE